MSPIFDHVGITVRDFSITKAFYEKALAPLGIVAVMDFGTMGGFGRDQQMAFWVGQERADFQTPEQLERITPIHLCFAASSRAQVDDFYRAAIAAGGKDNGGPGVRPNYHANYYGAFVLDPDGNNVEAVFHGAP